MKKFLLAGLLITGMSAMAQTPRLSLYEEFTGETCPPCAATNPGLNVLLASPTTTPKMVAIKWQVPIPSAPTATWSLYQTNKTEIDWRWKSTGYGYNPAINSAPSSKIDGKEPSVFGAASSHPADLDGTVISTAQSYTSAFSVSMVRAWDATFSSVNLTVSIVASANFTAVGPLVFRTVMVEREIHFPTQPGTNGEKDFEDVAIRSFPTLQAGTSMTSTWTVGQTQTFTLNCPLPSYTRDKAQVAFVGFIQDDGNRTVAQAVRAGVDPLMNDAQAVSITAAPLTCTNALGAQITFKNNGTNAITAATITPYIDGVAGTNYNWSGNLAIGASTMINLPTNPVTGGAHIFSYNITSVSGTDFNLNNNTAKTSFIIVSNYQGAAVAEGFTATAFPPANFATYNNYNGTTWIRNATVGGFGTSTQSTKLDFYSGVPANSVNELFLPPLHSSSLTPVLWFDVAYAQYSASDNDQLDVMVSDDCGSNWSTVYSKSGAGLATTGLVSTGAFTPNASKWRKEILSLTGFSNKDLLVKFVGTSDYGNNLYLDNINLNSCLLQTISVTSSDDDNVICLGESITLTASGATTYSWAGSQTTSTLFVSPTSDESYTVSIADPNSCPMDNVAAITVTVAECTGINHQSREDFDVTIFPNPANGSTSMKISTSATGKASVRIMNTLGQVVYTKQTGLEKGTNTLQVDVKDLAAGVYNVVIDTENGSTVKKLTVSK